MNRLLKNFISIAIVSANLLLPTIIFADDPSIVASLSEEVDNDLIDNKEETNEKILSSDSEITPEPTPDTEPEPDSECFPDLYLRGNFDGFNWEVFPEYLFTRDGNHYSLTLNSLVGEFVVADTEWNVKLGAVSESSREILATSKIPCEQAGYDFYAYFTNPVTIEFDFNPQPDENEIKVEELSFTIPENPVLTSGTLPIIYVNVFDEDGEYENELINKELSHKNYFDAQYWVEIPEHCNTPDVEPIGSAEQPLATQIKGRGNYTFIAFSKKPYKLKLGKKQNLLGLTPAKSKHYALLAHADDNYGFMRNFSAFELGKLIGLPWTPAQTPVELVINGNYRGIYFLTESIRVQEGRIDITEQDDNETDRMNATGGYVLEIDNYWEDNQIRIIEKGYPSASKPYIWFTFDSPEEYSDIQFQFVEHQLNKINDNTGDNSDELWSYLDLDDLVRYYLVNEIISHCEAFVGSTYLYRDRGENQKWHFSPLWDCGNAFVGSTDDHFFNVDFFHCNWIRRWLENEKFRQCAEKTWLWFMSEKYPQFEPKLDEYVKQIYDAVQLDRARWAFVPMPSHPGKVPVRDNHNLYLRLSKVKNHLKNKINWLKTVYGDFSEGEFEEPERDDTDAAPLPDFITHPVNIQEISISDPSNPSDLYDSTDLAVTYYNLQGIKVSNSHPGEILIAVFGNRAKKVQITGSSMLTDVKNK